jgi:hypothetical protein
MNVISVSMLIGARSMTQRLPVPQGATVGAAKELLVAMGAFKKMWRCKSEPTVANLSWFTNDEEMTDDSTELDVDKDRCHRVAWIKTTPPKGDDDGDNKQPVKKHKAESESSVRGRKKDDLPSFMGEGGTIKDQADYSRAEALTKTLAMRKNRAIKSNDGDEQIAVSILQKSLKEKMAAFLKPGENRRGVRNRVTKERLQLEAQRDKANIKLAALTEDLADKAFGKVDDDEEEESPAGKPKAGHGNRKDEEGPSDSEERKPGKRERA